MKILFSLLFIVFTSFGGFSQKLVCNPSLPKPKAKVVAKIGEIDNSNNQGVSRIGLTLFGQPNTSSRIDSIVMMNGKEHLRATDIDGVDFQRYFQWEENGEIYVEVDFPRRKNFKRDAKLVIYTVNGDIIAPIVNNKKGGAN